MKTFVAIRIELFIWVCPHCKEVNENIEDPFGEDYIECEHCGEKSKCDYTECEG